jgi:hypothetical protein
MEIIGLVGFKQSGKTTAANYLETKGYVRVNFKDGLIAEIKQNFPDLLRAIADTEYTEHFGGQINALFETKPPLVRALLQNYGTEVRRKDDPDYWVKQYIDELEDIATLGVEKIVTDDVRFINEAWAIKSVKNNGGTIIRLVRTDITSGGDHRSETEQLQIEADHTIEVGPGEHDKLYVELDKIVR